MADFDDNLVKLSIGEYYTFLAWMISDWYERERFNVQHPTFRFIFVLCTEIFWAMSFLWVVYTCRLSHPFEQVLYVFQPRFIFPAISGMKYITPANTNMENHQF